jgi:23S rRNA pseudouridine1911/1915/1917 synthase
MNIIYEDNHILVVNKPAGIAVQAAKKGEIDLLEEAKAFIKKRDNKPGNVFIGLVHRIDRPVSGLVMLAKTSKGASRLSEQMRNGNIEKTYQAVVHGTPSAEKEKLEHILAKVKHNNGYKAIVSRTGDESILYYEVLKSEGQHSILDIELETGRFHQIRAQLAAIGHPIVGDTLYGSRDRLDRDEIKLRAVRLAFNDIISGERRELEVPGFFL